jgi:hypothetical protein
LKKIQKIVVLWPGRFRDYEYYKYELNFLNQTFKLEIHNLEINNILLLNSKQTYKKFKNKIKQKNLNIFTFRDFKNWKKKTNVLLQNEKVFFISFLSLNFLSSYKYFKYLVENKQKILEFSNFGVPNYQKSSEKNIWLILQKFKSFFLRPKWGLVTFENILAPFLYKLILFRKINKKNFSILCVNKNEMSSSVKTSFNLILGSSWDFSKKLISKKNFLKFRNYGLFLANPGPKDFSDSSKIGQKYFTDSKTYFGSLNKFLSAVENKYKTYILVALHPKVLRKNQNKIYKRQTFYGKTEQLVKNAKFVISTTSTSISFPIIYNKPLHLIYSNDYNKDLRLKKMTFHLAKILKIKKFNIDQFLLPEKSDFLKKINKNILKNYKENYLSNNSVKIPNYKIIKQLINE